MKEGRIYGRFPLDFMRSTDKTIVLKDAETGWQWGKLTLTKRRRHWLLTVAGQKFDTHTASRDHAFFFACGVRLGAQ